MVIGFKKQFVPKILDGTKIHTIREDKHHRWKLGMFMHMATGVRSENYNNFNTVQCTGTRAIRINPKTKQVSIIVNDTEIKYFNEQGIETLAKNDGFDTVEEFWTWFNKDFVGKIIYWTDFKY